MRSLALFLLLLCGCSSDPNLFKVVAVSDGDTITVLAPCGCSEGNREQKIRLAQIDAPEKKQAFGTKAKDALAKKVFGKNVRLEGKKTDRWGRWIRDVYVDDRCVNMEMVQEGMAWNYQQYSKSERYAEAEAVAREHHVGLWADKHPTPPWEFRKPK